MNIFSGLQIELPEKYKEFFHAFCLTRLDGSVNSPENSPFPRMVDMWFTALCIAVKNGLDPIKIVNEKTFAYNPARINVGSIGYSYNLNKVIVSSLYVCFKTNDELEDLYLLAYLDTDKFNKDILRYEEGGVRQYLFYENFSQISIPLPDNDEQAKISNFLSSIDNKIEQVDKQLDESKQFKKALLQQMFV